MDGWRWMDGGGWIEVDGWRWMNGGCEEAVCLTCMGLYSFRSALFAWLLGGEVQVGGGRSGADEGRKESVLRCSSWIRIGLQE